MHSNVWLTKPSATTSKPLARLYLQVAVVRNGSEDKSKCEIWLFRKKNWKKKNNKNNKKVFDWLSWHWEADMQMST